jgi:hypothetical protein
MTAIHCIKILGKWLVRAGMVLPFLVTGCATGPPALMAAHTPPGALYLAEVTGVPEGMITRNNIVNDTRVYQWLLSSGIADEDIVDGSLERGRIYCCGGPNDGGGATFFYKPPEISVNPGDIIEIRAGSKVVSKHSAQNRINIATRRILTYEERKTDTLCRWNPDNPALWQRVLYCDWMLSEGWIQEDRWYNTPWYTSPARELISEGGSSGSL